MIRQSLFFAYQKDENKNKLLFKIAYFIFLLLIINNINLLKGIIYTPGVILLQLVLFIFPILELPSKGPYLSNPVIELIKEKSIFLYFSFISLFLFYLQLLFGHTYSFWVSLGGLSLFPVYLLGLYFPRIRKWVPIFISLLISYLLYSISFEKYSIGHSGNMLEYIEAAIQKWIGGQNPFLSPIKVRDYIYPNFAYGPFFLLIYGVTELVNIDLRIINLAFYMIFAFFLSKRSEQCLVSFNLTLTVLICPWILYLIVTKHIFFYGVIITMASHATLSRNILSSSVLSTFLFLSRQFGVLIAFFNWLYFNTIASKIYWAICSILIAIISYLIIVQTELIDSFVATFLPDSTLLISHYNQNEVVFSSIMSPGTGSGYNFSHLIKFYFPEWTVYSCLTLIILTFIVAMVLNWYNKLSIQGAQYLTYFAFIFCSFNYSNYFLWGVIALLFADVIRGIDDKRNETAD